MRGAPKVNAFYDLGNRIIPAYAGSTWQADSAPCGPRDHPRVCGEHCSDRRFSAASWGSSPRMRGAQTLYFTFYDDRRIIPAYAGSTYIGMTMILYRQDHPRVCGEHRRGDCLGGLPGGSSPRMRGAPATLIQGNGIHWIIPAYAGSTDIRVAGHHVGKDHPRVCGEHT